MTPQEIIESILDALNLLAPPVIEEEQYAHVARAADAIRDLASDLDIEVGIYSNI